MKKKSYGRFIVDCFKHNGLKTTIMARFLRLCIGTCVIVAMVMLAYMVTVVRSILTSVAGLTDAAQVSTILKSVTTKGLLIALLLLIIGLIINILIATKIAYPIRAAANGLKNLSEGDLHTEIESVRLTGDETGLLITSLHTTVDELKGYIDDIERVLQSITDGKLNVSIDKEYSGDFVSIKDNLTSIIKALGGTFATANSASKNLLSGAREVETASQSLAEASTLQASAVVEISSSIDNIADSTKANSEDVARVNGLTKEAKAEADHGDEQMQRLTSAMNEISVASQNIAKIMKVIDDIAFQTNILALNASVEAARAGQHGRGFAVVADEVRNLAGKSADASAEIAEMINDSIEKIKVGTELADDTASELKKIVADIDEIANVMDNIAQASASQSEATEQIRSGIEHISTAVQNNSATSEECAASSVELARQAKGLADQIAYYRI